MPTDSIKQLHYTSLSEDPRQSRRGPHCSRPDALAPGTGECGCLNGGGFPIAGHRPTARTDLPAPRVQRISNSLHKCQGRTPECRFGDRRVLAELIHFVVGPRTANQIHHKQVKAHRPVHLTAASVDGPESERKARYAIDVEGYIHHGGNLTN